MKPVSNAGLFSARVKLRFFASLKSGSAKVGSFLSAFLKFFFFTAITSSIVYPFACVSVYNCLVHTDIGVRNIFVEVKASEKPSVKFTAF